jgi:GMP synthase (glutamine-hydrolysing)
LSADPRTQLGHAPDDDRILILDYGSQYTQLIARRVREAGVYSEIRPYDLPVEAIVAFGATGVILSGGPESVGDESSPEVADAVLELGVPILGICYGMQALAAKLGGAVSSADHREFGYAEVEIPADRPLLGGLVPVGELLSVWMSHGDRVDGLPDSFVPIAASANAPLAGMADPKRRHFGLQFHPKVTHTEHGQQIIVRFVHDICGCASDWTSHNIIKEHIDRVREEVGDGKVLLGLSGGVDSSVVAALLHEAIGDQLICVFVDNGLLRLDEGDQVMAVFAEHLGVNVIRVNAEDEFLSALEGVADPEEKRKIIGRKFIDVFEREANRLEDIGWLAQGTIYPDVIESAGAATGKAHVIKSHHNVGGLPDMMRLKLVEPLRDLFKD